MERLGSYGDYARMVQGVGTAARASGAKVLSNDFLLPPAARELIAGGLLGFEEHDGNLYLLRDRGGFHELSLRVSDARTLTVPDVPPDTKVVWPFRADRADDLDSIDEVAAKIGFRPARTLIRMVRDASAPPPTDSDGDPVGVVVASARPVDLDAVSRLLEGSFDPVLAELPDRRALGDAIGEGRVLVASMGGAVVGAIHVGVEGRGVWIRQLAVDGRARGRRVGTALVRAHIERFSDEARRFMLWVDEANAAARGLYGGCGYGEDGHGAREYLPST